jgi:hypothetical protein
MDVEGEAPMEAEKAYHEFLSKMKDAAMEINSREAMFLPYEVFKQYNELVTENMKQIYNMIHGIAMKRNVTIEFELGSMSFAMTGPQDELEKISANTKEMLDLILSRLLKKSVVGTLNITSVKGVTDDKRGYC